jgi:epoxyqueuosine reductase QueG
METKEFKDKVQKEFEKDLADKKDWIDSLELDCLDEELLIAKLKDCFVNGMKYGVKIVKEVIE